MYDNIYMCASFIVECTADAQESMLEIPPLVGLFVQGLRSNLWGLACPFYCTGPSIGLALSCYLLGFLSGVFLCAWIVLRFDFVPWVSSTSSVPPQVPPAARPGHPRTALLGYLHGPQSRR